MTQRPKSLSAAERETVRAALHRDVAKRNAGYRAKALKMFPHVCGSCAREFEGKRLKELTVHHRDHDHNNNPPDGSNWEMLCIYCHDHEHEKLINAKHRRFAESDSKSSKPGLATPFENLGDLS
ncbi:MAG: hypothetical protein ACI9OU_001172 [Candidatus Promineifilaceae bacterium]|jgi:hypothetical protein